MAKRYRVFMIVAVISIIISSLLMLTAGRYPLTVHDVFFSVINPNKVTDEVAPIIMFDVRLPRVLMSLLVGAGLSVAGATMQAVFSNPLVSEHVLGVSSGAGFGAALGIMFFGTTLLIQISATIFGLIAMGVAYTLSKKHGKVSTLMLILSGTIVSSLFSSGISILQLLADPEQELPTIVFWLMGGLTSVVPDTLYRTGTIILIALTGLIAIKWHLNVISLSEDEATSMGMNVKRFRLMAIILTAVITAVSVASCGMISFIGVVVPHFSRMIIGEDNKYVIPVTAVIGAGFMLIVDTIARSLLAAEIPLSILTSLIGAPAFAYMLRKTGGISGD